MDIWVYIGAVIVALGIGSILVPIIENFIHDAGLFIKFIFKTKDGN